MEKYEKTLITEYVAFLLGMLTIVNYLFIHGTLVSFITADLIAMLLSVAGGQYIIMKHDNIPISY